MESKMMSILLIGLLITGCTKPNVPIGNIKAKFHTFLGDDNSQEILPTQIEPAKNIQVDPYWLKQEKIEYDSCPISDKFSCIEYRSCPDFGIVECTMANLTEPMMDEDTGELVEKNATLFGVGGVKEESGSQVMCLSPECEVMVQLK